MIITINTDGGSRGNPGEAAIGIVIANETDTIEEISQTIGIATNNEAEYSAVLVSVVQILSRLSTLKPTKIIWKLDSKLVVEQLSKNWKIKEPRMQELARQCWVELSKLPCPYTFVHVPREENKAADLLVNQALDEAKSLT